MTTKPLSSGSPRVSVSITAETISKAMPRDSGHCMIADAVRDAVPAAKAIAVDLQTIRFSLSDKAKRYTYLTPRSAQEALVRFDQGHAVEPFAFQLRRAQVTPIWRRRKDTTAPSKQAALRVRDGGGNVAVRVGGQVPPKAALSNVGRRRSFGLRQLDI